MPVSRENGKDDDIENVHMNNSCPNPRSGYWTQPTPVALRNRTQPPARNAVAGTL